MMLLNEVLLNGTDSSQELLQYVELKNTTTVPLSLNGWSLSDQDDVWSVGTDIAVAPGGYAVLVLNGQAPSVPNGVPALVLNGNPISLPNSVPVLVLRQKGKGLDPARGRLQLKAVGGVIVDAISWGDDTSVLNPAATAPPAGQSLSRVPDGTDTDFATDFKARARSPGTSNGTDATATNAAVEVPAPGSPDLGTPADTPSDAPTATTTDTPNATATPSPAATDALTPTPTATATATATPAPTPTALPPATDAPTSIPAATAAPSPTAISMPTETVTPAAT
ncbi:MAG: lamin tail domain-containing protein, partial [Dehalococcoidia bacterium]